MIHRCEKCGHKSGTDVVYHNGIFYPKYIKLGKNGTRMRFQKSRTSDDMIYYRHGGNWEIDIILTEVNYILWKVKRFYSHIPEHKHIDNIRLYKTSYKDWKEDNGGYADGQ